MPNAFRGHAPKTFVDTNQTLLSLVDNGEDGELVPFTPLLVKAREIDTIFGIDAVSAASYDPFAVQRVDQILLGIGHT